MDTKLKENEVYKCIFKYKKLTSDQKKLVRLKGFNYAQSRIITFDKYFELNPYCDINPYKQNLNNNFDKNYFDAFFNRFLTIRPFTKVYYFDESSKYLIQLLKNFKNESSICDYIYSKIDIVTTIFNNTELETLHILNNIEKNIDKELFKLIDFNNNYFIRYYLLNEKSFHCLINKYIAFYLETHIDDVYNLPQNNDPFKNKLIKNIVQFHVNSLKIRNNLTIQHYCISFYINYLNLNYNFLKNNLIKFEIARYGKHSGTILDRIIDYYSILLMKNNKQFNHYNELYTKICGNIEVYNYNETSLSNGVYSIIEHFYNIKN